MKNSLKRLSLPLLIMILSSYLLAGNAYAATVDKLNKEDDKQGVIHNCSNGSAEIFDVGDTFVVKKLKFRVVETSTDSNECSVVLVGTTISKRNLKKLVAPSYIEKDGISCYVTGIGKNAFKGFKKLKSLVIEGGNTTTIGEKAFYGDKNLRKITFEDFLDDMKIGRNAFKGIYKKTIIKIPYYDDDGGLEYYTRLSKKVLKKRTGITKKMKIKMYPVYD